MNFQQKPINGIKISDSDTVHRPCFNILKVFHQKRQFMHCYNVVYGNDDLFGAGEYDEDFIEKKQQ